MKNNYSYAGIAFIILIFGIWGVNELDTRTEKKQLVTFEKVPDFNFINQFGKEVSNNDYAGKVYVVEFFFTTCPTICPIMTQNTVLLQNKYYGNPHFGIASISINPKHDTPEVMKSYADEKGATMESWNFLTGDEAAIFKFSNEGFKLYAGKNENVEGGFEHSGLFALVDKNGFIRSRTVTTGGSENPIKFYDGLDVKAIEMLKEDIQILLEE
ncbi:SCO family protein [Flavicella marina]|uniref:SCO family protein n=1 Tax=Flavicella marina TaxID=1475951 RepID=UPI001264A15C|nr:SCO family protein [Flavicella marina]